MKNYEHEFYVTRKCTKMEYFTVRAESMEEAEWEAENGNELFNFDWEEFDFEIVEIKEEEIPEQQLTLSGILQLVKCNPNEHRSKMKTVTEKRYFVTTKFEKYGTYTIMARSKEHAIQMWKDGDWNFDDYESDYGEYNEVIDEIEEEVFADTQLSLEGVLV